MTVAGSTQVNVEGDVSGQIAIGKNIVQVQNKGGVVIIVKQSTRSPFRRRPRPIQRRPQPYPALLDRVSESLTIQSCMQEKIPASIFGRGGIGKTTFLSHMAHLAETNTFADGVIYLQVKQQGPDDLLQMLFSTFYSSAGNVMPTAGQLRHGLQGITAVILLDDTELSREDVQSLLTIMPSSCFIFASLQRCLWGNGKPISLGGLPEEQRIELFESELGRSLSEEERSDVQFIGGLLQGHPLKIIAVADWATTTGKTISEIRKEVEQNPDPFAVESELLTTLGETQKKVLAILGAAGGVLVPLRIIGSLLSITDAQSTLARLMKMGLAWSQGTHYGLTSGWVDLIEKLWDLSSWEDALIRYFSNRLSQQPGDTLAEDSSDVLMKVIQTAGQKQRWPEVIRIGRALERVLILGKRWQAWQDVLNLVLTAARASGDQSTEAWALHQLGSRALCLNDDFLAEELLTQALQIRQAIVDNDGLAVTRHNLNVLHGIPVNGRVSVPPVNSELRRYITYGLGGTAGLCLLILGGWWLWLNRPVPAVTLTAIPIISSTPTSTLTQLPPVTFTPTPTLTQSSTDTPTATLTSTLTNTPTATSTGTPTPTMTATATPTRTNPPPLAVCPVELYAASLPYSQYTYMPPKVGSGDADFGGHGPDVYVSVTLIKTDQRRFRLEIYMLAREDQPDNTRAEGTERINDFIVLPPGYVYYGQHNTYLSTNASYKDSDHALDTIYPKLPGPAEYFVVVGDTDGNEAGTRTRVTVYFDTIRFQVYRTGNCTPPTPLPTPTSGVD